MTTNDVDDVDFFLQRVADGAHDDHSIWKTMAEVAFAKERGLTRREWRTRYEAVEDMVDGEESFVERERQP